MMKRFVFTLLILSLLKCFGLAQENSVENSLWGVQAGILPLSVYNETKLTNNIALRSELAFGLEWSYSSFPTSSFQWAVIPRVIVEPRYYYNLNRRSRKQKRIDGNSGNYFSVAFAYNYDFVISSSDVKAYPAISLVPMYGLRRNIGQNFNFEFAFGLGYAWVYKDALGYDFGKEEYYTYSYTDHGALGSLRLALGYKF